MLYENEPTEIILCDNCDSEFTVVKIDDDQSNVEFCPYCGEVLGDVDDDLDEDLDDDGY
jgi:uncharacterized paraquat-inducible protein A